MARFWAHGTTVTIGSASIGGLNGIDHSGDTRGKVEITDSQSGGVREFLAGMLDTGTVQLVGRRMIGDEGQLALRANQRLSDAIVGIVIQLPLQAAADSPSASAGPSITFDAFVEQFDQSFPMVDETAAEFTATLKVSGEVSIDGESI